MKQLNEYPTPETDAAEIDGNVKNQSDNDEMWPFEAIKRGYEKARDLERRLALCRDALKEAHDALDAARMMVENEIGCCEIERVSANAWPDLLDGRVSGGGIKSAISAVAEALKATEPKQ